MRSRDCTPQGFRAGARTIARSLAYEATADLPLVSISVDTPMEQTVGQGLGVPVVAVPILRAGLGLLDGFLEIVPTAATGFIGLRRNEETLAPFEYYRNLPDLSGAHVFLLDPMVATGGSSCAALAEVVQGNPARVSLLSIISAPEGIALLAKEFPDVMVYSASLDRGLSNEGFILPGLGDAGDRLWETL
jgi:uracil phosphoribosyltransferase